MSVLEQPRTWGRVIHDEPAEVYYRREIDVVSNSGLKIIDEQSPAHYLHWCQHPEDDESSKALDFGHAFHAAVLEPHAFDRGYCVLPPDMPNRPTIRQINAKKPSPETLQLIDLWQRWDSDHAGMTNLSAATYDQVRGMAEAMHRHVLEIPASDGKIVRIPGAELFAMCRREVTLRWTDPRTGIQCKARADLECAELEFGGDLKSTIDASPEGFARAIANYRYHQQHAHYCDGAQAALQPWKDFLFFACEKQRPYVPCVYTIPPMAEERGRFLRDRALDKLKPCLESGVFPGYSNTITEAILPSYAYYD